MELTWGELRSYNIDVVTTLADIYKGTVFSLKQFLTGAIGPNNAGVWTVVSSSDGAGNYANSDLWVDTSDVVNSINTTNHSWILLRKATLGLDLVIDCVSGSSGNEQFPALYAAPVGTFSGGTASVAPTSLQSFGFANSGYRDMNNGLAGVTSGINALLSTRGDFWFLFSHSGTNVVHSAFGISKLSDIKNNDPFPWAMFLTGNGQAFAKAGLHPMEGLNGGGIATPCIHCRSYSGVAPANTYVYNAAGIVWPGIITSGSGFPSNPSWVVCGPLENTALAQSDGKTLTFPVYVGISQTNIQDFKGRWPDALLGSAAVAVNTASPSVEAQQYIKAGPHMWLPFSGGILGI